MVRVDTASGLKKIIRNPRKLKDHNIVLDPGRPKNKNSNAIVDKRIRELEDELRKISPEGSPVDQNVLTIATKSLNEKVRKFGFSSNELLFRRLQDTHQELDIKDSDLKAKISKGRKESINQDHKTSATPKTLKPGDIGFIRQEHSKHEVRPSYLVTEVDYKKNLIKAKKMLHIHKMSQQGSKIKIMKLRSPILSLQKVKSFHR